MQKIITNKIKCNKCGDEIESKHTHDFKFCKCGTVAVDGGKSYLRRSFKNTPEDFTELSEYKNSKLSIVLLQIKTIAYIP